MPNLTSNFEYNKPLVNNATDADLWGGQLNSNWDDLDTDLALTTATKTANFTVGATEYNFTYLIDAASGNITAALPASSAVFNGFCVRFKAINLANTITLDGNGSETIEGAATYALTSVGDTVEIVNDGSNWRIVGNTASGIPAGAVMPFAFSTPPTGWLECDGSEVSRTTYSALYAAIGDRFGNGDGSTTFDLPDLRGEFVRGWDHGAGNDPDAASRTDSGDGTTGDNVGTKQANQVQSHTHGVGWTGAPRGDGGSNAAVNIFQGSTVQTAASGGNETRPRNVYLMYCIKT